MRPENGEQFAQAIAKAGMDAYLLSYYDGTDKEQANAEVLA